MRKAKPITQKVAAEILRLAAMVKHPQKVRITLEGAPLPAIRSKKS